MGVIVHDDEEIAGLLYIEFLLATPAPDSDKSLGEVKIFTASKPIADKLKDIINK